MVTWTNFASGAGAATTTWNYDLYRGWLTNKVYADGNGPMYGYTGAGRLSSRTWVRGSVTTYGYDVAGRQVSVSYSDSTPAVTNTLSRLGRLASVKCDGATTTLSNNLAGQELSESYSGGALNSFAITNGYDSLMRRTSVAVLKSGVPVVQQSFGYDAASRLKSVTYSTNSATYVYLANSPLVGQILFTNNGALRMTTTRQYDFLNRLTSVSSAGAPSSASPISFSYLYNSANERVRRTDPDSSYWRYGYDALGQVTAGKHYWQDQTPVAGQQYGYAFDDIGNRTGASAGGDQNAANVRSASYSANNLNQYTSRTVPGYLQVMGLEFATNPVTVNSSTAYRKGEYFEKELSVANTSNPAWQSVTVSATGETSVTGDVFVPKTPEAFTFDLDGNQTTDGRFNYVWDGENRLVAMNARTLTGPTNSLKFAYDWRGRRILKQVFANTNWSGTATNDLRFAYDGWNLLGEITNSASTLTLVRSYAWGLDLSGTIQGAGGVGGLLVFAENSGATILDSHYAAFDGNGNVMALVGSADASQSARYECGPFGEVIRATGPMAKANPFRFSTKYQDDETDLLYYGYRYYSASTGRWLSRDLLAERGGKNLFAFVANSPVYLVDPLGLQPTGSGPWGPGLGDYWCSCTCKSVEVTYDPGGDTMQLGPYQPLILGIIPSGYRFGSKVHVAWAVSGAPWLCHYYQDEGGTVTKATGPGGVTQSKAGKDGNEVFQVYTDYQGIDFTSILPGSSLSGTWTETVHWNVTFRCKSSDGTTKTRHDSFDVSGTTKVPWW